MTDSLAGTELPLVSFIMLSYNHEKFIADAFHSALDQSYQPLEIIVCDDCSKDNSFDVLRKIAEDYEGPHEVKLHRNPTNLGLSGNMNEAYKLARGAFFVVMAGDDISVPERTTELVNRLCSADNPVDMVCSYFEEIDEEGMSTGFIKHNVLMLPDMNLPVNKWKCGATGATLAYTRKLIDKYDLLDSRIISEDWVLSFRAWAGQGITLVPLPLLKHRTHGNNLSQQHLGVHKERDPDARFKTRKAAAADKYARIIDWQRVWHKEGKKAPRITEQLLCLTQLCELELMAYESGRIKSLVLAIRALTINGGLRSAIRIVLRNALMLK